MDLKQLIERAEIAAGSQIALGELIGQSPSKLRDAKSGRCGLPSYACVLIADLIEEDEIVVIAASELATEKHENRRAIWQKKLETVAAMLVLAFVTTLVTPTPSQATECAKSLIPQCILCQIIRRFFKAVQAVFEGFVSALPTTAARQLYFAG